MLTARVKGTVRVLGEFSKLREAEYSRSDYMQVRVRVRVRVGVRVRVRVRVRVSVSVSVREIADALEQSLAHLC